MFNGRLTKLTKAFVALREVSDLFYNEVEVYLILGPSVK